MPEIRYVPTLIRWQDENGQTQQRTLNIQEGMRLNINGKKYTAKAYDTSKGKMPLLSLSKEDAYSVLGFSRMYDDKKDNVFTLDNKDFQKAQESYGSNIYNYLEDRMKNRAGTGAKVETAYFPVYTDKNDNNKVKPDFGEFRIYTKPGHKISIFNK